MDDKSYALKCEIKNWLLDSESPYIYAVTLPLKPIRTVLADRGRYFVKLTHIDAEATYSFFLKRLNNSLFGNSAKRYRKSVVTIPVLEGDGKRKLIHYHCAMGNFPSYVTDEALQDTIVNCWRQTPFGNKRVHIQPIRDVGWMRYLGKDVGLSSNGGIDICNLRLPTTPPT